MANGFHEQTDALVLQRRFEEDNVIRHSMGIKPMAIDSQFLAAIAHGMPASSGLALGLDRLFAIFADKTSVAEVMSFAFPVL